MTRSSHVKGNSLVCTCIVSYVTSRALHTMSSSSTVSVVYRGKRGDITPLFRSAKSRSFMFDQKRMSRIEGIYSIQEKKTAEKMLCHTGYYNILISHRYLSRHRELTKHPWSHIIDYEIIQHFLSLRKIILITLRYNSILQGYNDGIMKKFERKNLEKLFRGNQGSIPESSSYWSMA